MGRYRNQVPSVSRTRDCTWFDDDDGMTPDDAVMTTLGSYLPKTESGRFHHYYCPEPPGITTTYFTRSSRRIYTYIHWPRLFRRLRQSTSVPLALLFRFITRHKVLSAPGRQKNKTPSTVRPTQPEKRKCDAFFGYSSWYGRFMFPFVPPLLPLGLPHEDPW